MLWPVVVVIKIAELFSEHALYIPNRILDLQVNYLFINEHKKIHHVLPRTVSWFGSAYRCNDLENMQCLFTPVLFCRPRLHAMQINHKNRYTPLLAYQYLRFIHRQIIAAVFLTTLHKHRFIADLLVYVLLKVQWSMIIDDKVKEKTSIGHY